VHTEYTRICILHLCVCWWHCTLIQWYSSIACRTSSWDRGDWKCNTINSCPFGSLSADWTRCCAAQLRLKILSQNRQLMQIQKLVLGPKFGAHIVEQSNDGGPKTIFVSSRSSCSRQKTSCVDKVKHFNFCCIIREFLFFREFYSYKYYYLYYWTCSSLWLIAGCLQLHIFYLFTSGGTSYRAKGFSSLLPQVLFQSDIFYKLK